jgi:hypothetical protein
MEPGEGESPEMELGAGGTLSAIWACDWRRSIDDVDAEATPSAGDSSPPMLKSRVISPTLTVRQNERISNPFYAYVVAPLARAEPGVQHLSRVLC